MVSTKKPAKRVKAGTSKTKAAERKAKFVEVYIANGGNAKQAAISAGYAPSGAESIGSRLTRDVKVAALLADRSQKVATITGLETERTLREVARIAYSDPGRFYKPDGTLIPVSELDEEVRATIASVEVEHKALGDGEVSASTVKVKQWDKNVALEKAMKFHGLYKEDNKQRGESLKVEVLFGTE